MANIMLYEGKVLITTGKDFDVDINIGLFSSELEAEVFLYMKNEIKDDDKGLILLRGGFLIDEFQSYIRKLRENQENKWKFRLNMGYNIYDLSGERMTYDVEGNLFLFNY